MRNLLIILTLSLLSSAAFGQQTAKDKILFKLRKAKEKTTDVVSEDFDEMIEEIIDILTNAESNTYPFNVINKEIEFSEDNKCECAMLIGESAVKRSDFDSRDILYSFNLADFYAIETTKRKNGNLIRLEFDYEESVEVNVIQENEVTRVLKTNEIDIAGSDLYAEQINLLFEEVADYCRSSQ